MRACIVAFAGGVGWLQQQPTLPEITWAWMLLPASILGFLVWRCQAGRFSIATRGLFAAIFLGTGFFWAAGCAQLRLVDALPNDWEGRDIQLVGVVAGLPQIRAHSTRFVFDVEQVVTRGATVPGRVSLAWYKERGAGPDSIQRSIHAGERWNFTVRLKRPHGNVNPHGFDFEGWAFERNIRAVGYVRKADDNQLLSTIVNQPSYLIARLRQGIRERFARSLSGFEYAGVLVALAIGDQLSIPNRQWQIFTRTGINHLVSISGLHVTMVSGLIFALTSWLWRRSGFLTLWLPARKAAVTAGLLAAVGYALLAGFAIPAQRTIYMLTVLAVALWFGRITSATSVLSWALLIVILLDPWAVLSPGFWLSFGAVAIILLVSAGRMGRTHWLAGWIRIQWAITLGLIPLLLAIFQQTSLVSPLANAIAIPTVGLLVVPLTLLATFPFLDFLLLPAHSVLQACMEAMQWFSQMPQAVWSQHMPPAWAVACGVTGIAWLLLPGGSGLVAGFPARWLGAVGLLPMFLALPQKPAAGEMWVTVLDVGQGLAVVARTENYTLLYDTGPNLGSEADSGDRIIIPYLRGEGIREVDTMIVTHSDSDHSGGALSVLEAIPVGRLFSSLPGDHPVQRASTNGRRCIAGESWQWDGVRFDMLHPLKQDYINSKLKTNALSCVLKITTAHGSVLLPADIEKKSEYRLLAENSAVLPSTILVAPHHGSKTSSTYEFVRQVNPQLVVFTVGYRNRFGHPRHEVVERYRILGSRLLRSDRDGAVILRFAKGGVEVSSLRAQRPRYWRNVMNSDA